MSDPSPSVAKRAEQLARSGDYEFVYQIERKLKAEGYPGVEAKFKSDPQMRLTLREIIGPRRSLGRPSTKT